MKHSLFLFGQSVKLHCGKWRRETFMKDISCWSNNSKTSTSSKDTSSSRNTRRYKHLWNFIDNVDKLPVNVPVWLVLVKLFNRVVIFLTLGARADAVLQPADDWDLKGPTPAREESFTKNPARGSQDTHDHVQEKPSHSVDGQRRGGQGEDQTGTDGLLYADMIQ